MARLCPHCDTRASYSPIGMSQTNGKWGKPGNSIDIRIALLTCTECGGLLMVLSKYTNDNLVEFLEYPASVASVSAFVPSKVAADYISAVNCMSIGENKAAAAMFRRTLQQIMIDKKAVDDLLWKQIDDLAAKGIITKEIKDWAHEIRYWGNDGAHPATDYLDEISNDEITEVKEFLERVFEYVYIMPSKLEASRISRKAKQNQTP